MNRPSHYPRTTESPSQRKACLSLRLSVSKAIRKRVDVGVMDMKFLYALEVLDSFPIQDWEFTPSPSMDHGYQMSKERWQAIKKYTVRNNQAVPVKVKEEVC